jgi:hypothetical protein
VARAIGGLLPWVELGIAIALVLGFATSLTGVFVALVLGAFTLAAIFGIRRGAELPCSCHVPGSTGVLGWGALVRNCALLALTLTMTAMTITVQADDAAATGWGAYRLLTSSVDTLLLFALLLVCTVVSIWLVEWMVDLHVRVTSLSRTVAPEVEEISSSSPFGSSLGSSGHPHPAATAKINRTSEVHMP